MKQLKYFSKCVPWVKTLLMLSVLVGIFFANVALADGNKNVGDIATNITAQFSELGKLILAVSFLAGIGFIMAAIFKFKQHKDNPTQIPLGTPIAMLIIGAFLVFLPNLVGPVGQTIFGANSKPGGFTGKGVTELPGGGS